MTNDIPLRPGKLARILRFGPLRFVLAAVAVIGSVSIVQAASVLSLVAAYPWLRMFVALAATVAGLAAYVGFARGIERRWPVAELGLQHAGREWLLGAAIGAVMFCLTIAAVAFVGDYHIVGRNPASVLLRQASAALGSGVIEELLLRGLFFRMLEEWAGSLIALAASAILFGALHLMNPNATVVAAAAIALEAGLMLAAAFMVTRRLWFPIGIHMAWNFVQGGVFGVAVSGNQSLGLLRSTLSGSTMVSGGAFGAEASIFAVFFGVLTTAILLTVAHRKQEFRVPAWRKRPAAAA
jgi:uncharacterized protein